MRVVIIGHPRGHDGDGETIVVPDAPVGLDWLQYETASDEQRLRGGPSGIDAFRFEPTLPATGFVNDEGLILNPPLPVNVLATCLVAFCRDVSPLAISPPVAGTMIVVGHDGSGGDCDAPDDAVGAVVGLADALGRSVATVSWSDVLAARLRFVENVPSA